MQICHFLEHLLNQLRSCFLEIAVRWVQTNIQILHRFKHFLLWRLKMPSFLYQDLVCLFQWPSLTLQWSCSLPAVASSGQKNFSCSVLGARKEHQCLCMVSHEESGPSWGRVNSPESHSLQVDSDVPCSVSWHLAAILHLFLCFLLYQRDWKVKH